MRYIAETSPSEREYSMGHASASWPLSTAIVAKDVIATYNDLPVLNLPFFRCASCFTTPLT